MSKKRKYKHATREHSVAINNEILGAYLLFKELRPDIKTKQEFMEVAWETFKEDYVVLSKREFLNLDTKSKHFNRKFKFRMSYQDTKMLPKMIWDTKVYFNLEKPISKGLLFRKAILNLLQKYKLFDTEYTTEFLTEIYEFNEFLAELDYQIRQEIEDAIKNDDKSTITENVDDKSLETENIDDKTLEEENQIEDIDLYIEEDTKY